MAQHTEIKLVDDIDGSDAAESIEFSIDGKAYEIDLNETNAQALREGMTVFINAARKVGRLAPTRRAATERPPTDRLQNQAIRQWALSKGMDVSERGRIRQEVLDAFHAEH